MNFKVSMSVFFFFSEVISGSYSYVTETACKAAVSGRADRAPGGLNR